MSSDLELIKELEKEIGIKVDRLQEYQQEQLDTIAYRVNKEREIKALYVNSAGLTKFPLVITKLVNLEKLHMFRNEFKSIPPEIGNLKNLICLWLPNNQLSYLPKEIGKLQKLRRLFLWKNNFSKIPKELIMLKKLETLKFGENPLSSEETDLVKQKIPILIDYLQNHC